MMRMLILFVGATDLGWKIRGWIVLKSRDDRSVDGLRRWTVVEDLGLIVPWTVLLCLSTVWFAVLKIIEVSDGGVVETNRQKWCSAET